MLPSDLEKSLFTGVYPPILTRYRDNYAARQIVAFDF